MPTIQQTVSLSAGQTVEDLLVNNVLAIPPQNSIVDVALVAAATGVVCDINVGTRQVAPGIIPSEANRVPQRPEDIISTFGVRAGERMLIKATNPTAGAIRLNYTLWIRPA